MLTVDDVVVEGLGGSEEGGWIDADGRDSRDGLSQVGEAPGTSTSNSHLKVPRATGRSSKKAGKQTEDDSVAAHRRGPLSPEFYEPPPEQRISERNVAQVTTDALYKEQRLAAPVPPSKNDSDHSAESAASLTDADKETTPGPGPSKLKTLQLLARRPFNAFGKKMREMEKSWWPSRSSQDFSRPTAVVPEPEKVESDVRTQQTRRSEDLLSRASPRECDTATIALKSRSVELDRIQLPSKVIPLRPSGGAGYKRRPTIPDSFSKPPQELVRKDVAPPPRQTPNGQPRISDLRHPWMKQLHLPAVSQTAPVGPSTGPTADLSARQNWPKMVEEITSHRNIIPSVSLTAASVALSQPFPAQPKKQQSPRRPPASLLGQSLPIPPRSGRSRASTISSQSSTTSSPSGKVIVSRRSYGQRLRSPGTREETGSIRSVGTSILFADSPPGSPGMRKVMSPSRVKRSPNAVRVRSPPTTVLLPKYSPRRAEKVPTLRRMPSSAFTDDSDIVEEQEWMDDDVEDRSYSGSRTAINELCTYQTRCEEVLPTIRPGFLEMTEATQTLSNLVRTFSGSSGSLSIHSSPYKKTGTPDRHVAGPGTPRGLYEIMEADEHSFARPSPPPHHIPTSVRQRLISIASLVSTEANSSFEDSEELQKLLDSIMAADLGGGVSCDTSGSRDMALLSPFGSPVEYRDSRTSDNKRGGGGEKEAKEDKDQTVRSQLPPPPKFLLNDRPISPPDSSWTHGNGASVEDGDGSSESGTGAVASSMGLSSVAPPGQQTTTAAGETLRIGAKTWSTAATHDDSGYASFF